MRRCSLNVSGTSDASELTWSQTQKWLLVSVLSLQTVIGVSGNCLVLLVKAKSRGRFNNRCWISLLSLTLSDLGCSALIMPGSLLAVLTGGQRSPWCEVVSLLKFTFITSSIGSITVLSVQRLVPSAGKVVDCLVLGACLSSWATGTVFGAVPVNYSWIKYDPAEMLCAVFWESSYSDMLIYILCASSVCIFFPFVLMILCSVVAAAKRDRNKEEDLSDVAPLLVAAYTLCYTPFVLSEVILLGRLDLSPSPAWLRTVSSLMSYLDCGLNPVVYCCHQDFREAALVLLWTRTHTPTEPVLTAAHILDQQQIR
uniref:G-protein coupled receptors family 1 profile domain-containing protein n=1 Tax=Knipowitschia caucasica TaxID=637954 RepID=A0AAV2LSK3_KNICA